MITKLRRGVYETSNILLFTKQCGNIASVTPQGTFWKLKYLAKPYMGFTTCTEYITKMCTLRNVSIRRKVDNLYSERYVMLRECSTLGGGCGKEMCSLPRGV